MLAPAILTFSCRGVDGDFEMKKIALAAAISLAASSAFAGGLAPAVMEPEPVVKEASSSAGGLVVPLLLLLVVAAAVASN